MPRVANTSREISSDASALPPGESMRRMIAPIFGFARAALIAAPSCRCRRASGRAAGSSATAVDDVAVDVDHGDCRAGPAIGALGGRRGDRQEILAHLARDELRDLLGSADRIDELGVLREMPAVYGPLSTIALTSSLDSLRASDTAVTQRSHRLSSRSFCIFARRRDWRQTPPHATPTATPQRPRCQTPNSTRSPGRATPMARTRPWSSTLPSPQLGQWMTTRRPPRRSVDGIPRTVQSGESRTGRGTTSPRNSRAP